jgi:2-polyprenyl-3-methyl-5-hydroxy-6-metoxy-1,4-benzoquinol methylase
MFTAFQYRLLKKISPAGPAVMTGAAYKGKSKLQITLGDQFLSLIRNKTVIDFGCGEGMECLEMAQNGARKVISIDIRESLLSQAAKNARDACVADRCEFAKSTNIAADVIVSLDSFEHFADPAAILEAMYKLLSPGGVAMISFGPTWYHPLGGHLFSVFPWAHLIFSEEALIRWRSDLRSDEATRFSEVEGGLNQMTIAQFEQLVRRSKFSLEMVETVPIRKLRPLHCKLTREFTTAIVRAKLARNSQAS